MVGITVITGESKKTGFCKYRSYLVEPKEIGNFWSPWFKTWCAYAFETDRNLLS
jgi:hypothetical protein